MPYLSTKDILNYITYQSIKLFRNAALWITFLEKLILYFAHKDIKIMLFPNILTVG